MTANTEFEIEVYFKVNLINGTITAHTWNHESGPYSFYKHFVNANYVSLGVLVQNFHENMIKNNYSDEWLDSQSDGRTILGSYRLVSYLDAIETRKHIYEEFNEYLI